MSGGGAPAGPGPALSARGARIAAGVPGLLDGGFALYVADPFDRERNPEGIVNLGTSENRLCFDLIEERLTRPDMDCLEPDLFQYPDTQGVRRHELHVIMDEIYMLSVYDDTTFTSVLSLDSLPDPERTHFMWGFSKDFGMSGIRVGVLYTRNHEVQKAVNQLAVFHSCPGPVQHVLTQFLKDRDWLDNVFFPTNKRRLKEAQNLLVDRLADIGIPVLKSSGGLYVWADFRKFLKSQTFEAELELWQKLLDRKLLISPGKAFYCYEPGWFRLVFSDSVDKIYLCIERLQQMLHTDDAKPVVNNALQTLHAAQKRILRAHLPIHHEMMPPR
uniref:1-aminocyclopropane-1-carboxylate synthase homolog (inactive) like n=1 Tax=Gallus gallus TaxID=9031 RepID=A0A8V0XID9_CHICK